MSNVTFTIEDDLVQKMLLTVEHAISGPSLMEFMRDDVAEFYERDIVDRFAYEGDEASGDWPPLSEGTIHIKRGMDLAGNPEDPNIRTGEMFNELTNAENYDTIGGGDWAQISIPGDLDPLTQTKLTTAQRGKANNPIPQFGPTPPRPVLATSEYQLAQILELLEVHIGSRIIGGIGF